MLTLLLFTLSLSPANLQLPEALPDQSYCASAMDDRGYSAGIACGKLPDEINPMASPECADVCPRGNSGQPEEPIGSK